MLFIGDMMDLLIYLCPRSGFRRWMTIFTVFNARKKHPQCGAPVKSRTLSWGSHKSNVTMVYCTQITTVFMGFINQRSNHWGAPRCIYHVFDHHTSRQSQGVFRRWKIDDLCYRCAAAKPLS